MPRFRLVTRGSSAFFQGVDQKTKSVLVTTDLLRARIFDDDSEQDSEFIALLNRLDAGFIKVNTLARLKTEMEVIEDEDLPLLEDAPDEPHEAIEDMSYAVDNDGRYYMEWPKPYGPVFTKDPGLARKISHRAFNELCAEIGSPLTKCPFPEYIAQTGQGCYFTGWDDAEDCALIGMRLSEAIVFKDNKADHATWHKLAQKGFKRKSLFLHTYIVEDERRGHTRTVQAISQEEAAITMDRTNNGYYVTHYSVYKSDEKGEATGDPVRFEVSWSSDWSVARLLTEKSAAPPDQRIDERELKEQESDSPAAKSDRKLQKTNRFSKVYGGGAFDSHTDIAEGHVIFFKQNACYFKGWVGKRPTFTRDLKQAQHFSHALPVRNELEKMILTDKLVVHGVKAIAGTLLVIHPSNIWYSADGWFIANEEGDYLETWASQHFTSNVTRAMRITDTRVLNTMIQLLSSSGIITRRTPGDAIRPYLTNDPYKIMIGNAYYLAAWKQDSDPVLTNNPKKAVSLGWCTALSFVNKLKTCAVNARMLRASSLEPDATPACFRDNL